MTHIVENNLYRVTVYGTVGNTFIESETKKELFQYLISRESKGAIITSVNLVQYDGKFPRIAFRNDTQYKLLKKIKNIGMVD